MSHRCKVIFIGDTGVGKTSITNRLIKDKFDKDSCPTIGAAFNSIKYNDADVTCEFWDTAGQEVYDSMSKMFYRNAKIVILVIDSSRLDSIKRIKPLIENLHDVIDENDYELILIANKIDEITDDLRNEIMNMIRKYINHGKLIYTSAKTGQNIDTLEMLIRSTVIELKNDKNLCTNEKLELEKNKKQMKSWKRFICFMK
jgi:small GTP-binding protein